MFFKNKASELAIKKLDYYIIELLEGKKLFYKSFYSLSEKELKIFYKYLNEHLTKN